MKSSQNKADMDKALKEAMKRVDEKKSQFHGNTTQAIVKREHMIKAEGRHKK